jgi:hypothetical protein
MKQNIPKLMQLAAAYNWGAILFHLIAIHTHQKCCAVLHMGVDEGGCFLFIINMVVV